MNRGVEVRHGSSPFPPLRAVSCWTRISTPEADVPGSLVPFCFTEEVAMRTLSLSLPLTLLLLLASCPLARAADEKGFVPLFDGKTLAGWEQHGGKAKYTVEDGMIVGTAVPNTSNSFLCTKKHYGDFILELEFKVDDGLNSGVQIRSEVFAKPTTIQVPNRKGEVTTRKIPADRVHGYQVEIDPSDRAFSGGIYDEARRGWLYDLAGAKHKKARDAFKKGEWNTFRIVAKGGSIKTWINGVPAADLKDSLTPRGLIALQVHGVGKDPKKVGLQVRWRNIRIKELKKGEKE
jgi:hypothetical protein